MSHGNYDKRCDEKKVIDLIQQGLAKSTSLDLLKIFLKKFQTYFSKFKMSRLNCEHCAIPRKDLCDQMSLRFKPRECLVHHMYSDIEVELEPYKSSIDELKSYNYDEIIEKIYTGASQKIASWENGTCSHMPTIATLKRVADAFCCSVSDLVSDDKADTPIAKINTPVAYYVSENDRKFFCGTFYIYSRRPSKTEFDVGLLSIVEEGLGLQAYFRWKLDDKDQSIVQNSAQLAVENPSEYFQYANDYKGQVQCVDGGLFIALDKITEANDSVDIIIPPLRVFHKQIENETGEIQSLCAGAGIVSTLQTSIGRPPLAYTVCFSSTDSYLLEDDDIVKLMEDIIRQESDNNGIQYIKMDMNAVESFIISANKKI